MLLAFLGLGSFSALYVVAVGGDYLHARLFPEVLAVTGDRATGP